ncbi:MAG TPA: DUF1028 domain-containing protein [Solirubrobacterales bacterium]|nr:DUF1028 domain-containing protein [Solirubrobacterales bacterium]
MTASIVARDPGTGELGVGVFTAWPAVGAVVPFAEPGVAAIATQSLVEISFGPRALEMLKEGVAPADAVERLIGSDPKPAVRQLGVLAADGESAGFTGEACVAYAGEAAGDDCRCQANMMASERVPQTMVEAFDASDGELALRLLAALEAGEGAGGDARGRMSAAILVVPPEGEPWRRSVDLHVDYDEDPLAVLSRALRFHRAFTLLDLAEERAEAGDAEGAMQAGIEAVGLSEENPQLLLWVGLGAASDDLEVGLDLVRRALELQPSLTDFLARLNEDVAPSVSAVRAALGGEAS